MFKIVNHYKPVNHYIHQCIRYKGPLRNQHLFNSLSILTIPKSIYKYWCYFRLQVQCTSYTMELFINSKVRKSNFQFNDFRIHRILFIFYRSLSNAVVGNVIIPRFIMVSK